MIFTTSHRAFRFPAQILALLMVLGLLCGVACGQQTTPKASSQSPQSTQALQALQALQATVPGPMQLEWYIAARYSTFGPAALASVNSNSLAFAGSYSSSPDVTVSLTGKAVSVVNAAGVSVSFGALAPGTNVIVCNRSDSVVVFIVTPTGGANNAKR